MRSPKNFRLGTVSIPDRYCRRETRNPFREHRIAERVQSPVIQVRTDLLIKCVYRVHNRRAIVDAANAGFVAKAKEKTMAKKRFALVMLALFAAAGLTLSGCATRAASMLLGPGNFYSDTSSVTLRGEETSKVWFSIFGAEDYPPAERVARNNGITKIATVERYSRPGILNLWVEYTTIVTGE